MGRSGRERADACPGALTTHDAADGPLARIRLPGGVVDRHQLSTLAACAVELGDGQLHVTSRANVQLRALTDPEALAARLHSAGLLPSATHERARNILASPMSGVAGGQLDVHPLVAELDAAICSRAELSALPGRFQFGLDDGRGDLPATIIDVGWRAVDDVAGTLVVGGMDIGVRVPASAAVATLVDTASAFLRVRAADGSRAWHIRELDRPLDRLLPMIMNTTPRNTAKSVHDQREGTVRVGVHEHDTGGAVAVVAGLTFGTLTADQLTLLAELAPQHARFTPWRSAVLPGLNPRTLDAALARLDAAGFMTDDAHPALGVTACIGAPACASSAADVRADTQRILPALPATGPAIHVSGCSRRCGRPPGPHLDVVAGDDGYVLNDGPAIPAADLPRHVANAAERGTT